MNSQSNYCDHRSEPRFHPNFEQVRWRKSGSTELEAGELLDVSKMGLSFRVSPGKSPLLKLGEELSVGFLGSGYVPAQYAVVWEHWAEGGLAIGCARLTSDDLAATRRDSGPKLVLAMSRRTVAAKQTDLEPIAQSVVLGAMSSQDG